ncbi:hypothetical protein ACOJVU_01615 [Mycobacterium sp. THU-M104]
MPTESALFRYGFETADSAPHGGLDAAGRDALRSDHITVAA